MTKSGIIIYFKKSWLVVLGLLSLLNSVSSQEVFWDETFVGGVTGFGYSATPGYGSLSIPYHWDENMDIKHALLITHRYGRPAPYDMFLEETAVNWNPGNQYGNEVIDDFIGSQFYATHAQLIDPTIFNSGQCFFEMPIAPISDEIANEGFWSIYVLLFYTSPTITQPINVQVYLSDQRQDQYQFYQIPGINPAVNTDVGFALYSDRITPYFVDRSRVEINGTVMGDIGGVDQANPASSDGVRGHFYYENGELFGWDDDVANTTIDESDAIAVVNSYLGTGEDFDIAIGKVSEPSYSNAHPAFILTSTPAECRSVSTNIPRQYSYCRGAEVQLFAEGYAHYEWLPATGLSATDIASPMCSADTSTWYQVRMWNDSSTGSGTPCSQTIPIFVEVFDNPRPSTIEVLPSVCPSTSGSIRFENVPGKAPHSFGVGDEHKLSPKFTMLEAGWYDTQIESAEGCTWDTILEVPLDPLQTAQFDARPKSGYTPLEALFLNQSTDAEYYQWLVDGVPITTNEHFRTTFADSGSYEIALVAYRGSESCADTAFFSLRVDLGIEILLPNIITPNGDGRNEELVAQVQGISNISWTVFNRWGTALYSGESQFPSNDLLIWKPGSGAVPSGVYTVVMRVLGESGQRTQMSFVVTLK